MLEVALGNDIVIKQNPEDMDDRTISYKNELIFTRHEFLNLYRNILDLTTKLVSTPGFVDEDLFQDITEKREIMKKLTDFCHPYMLDDHAFVLVKRYTSFGACLVYKAMPSSEASKLLDKPHTKLLEIQDIGNPLKRWIIQEPGINSRTDESQFHRFIHKSELKYDYALSYFVKREYLADPRYCLL